MLAKTGIDAGRAEGSEGMRGTWLAFLLLGVAAVTAYANSFSGRFVFDDLPQVVDNPEVRELWPGLAAFLSRQRTFTTLTFALNRALGGTEPWGYHLVNLAVHLCAGLTLFAVVRRTLRLERFAPGTRRAAHGIALAAALLWLVHPLQTQSVTYVVQRGESLMGLFYLLTLYCTLRAATGERARLWQRLAVLACALGMASKPVMVSAPLVVLLFDRALLARSWRELVRQRLPLHAGLALTWLLLAATDLVSLLGVRGTTTIGFGMEDVSAREYALTQPEVVLHYLRLAFWPDPLVLDYGWQWVQAPADALLPALVLALLLAGSVLALARGHAAGFLGVWFFAILAPTSSFVPVRDAAFEHRMYLSLAAVILGVVLAAHAILLRSRLAGSRLGPALVLLASLALGTRTVLRNRDYRDPITLWGANLRDAPDNGRAYTDLAAVLEQAGRVDEAQEVLERGIGSIEDQTSQTSRVYLAAAHDSLGNLLRSRGRVHEAIEHYEQAARTWTIAETHVNWGSALRTLGRYEEALAQYKEALRLAPELPAALNNLAWLLSTCPEARFRDGQRAVRLASAAARAREFADPAYLDTLAAAWAEAGDFEQAREWQAKALALAPAGERAANAAHLELYRKDQPLRDGPRQ